MSSKFKKVIVGTAALTMSVLLAACGGQQTTANKSSGSSSSSTKPRTAENASTKAYQSANRLIRNHNYQGAYEELNNVNNRSTQAENLNTDLKNYLSAQNAYSNGNYDQAASNLKELKSTSPAMKDAYATLQDKITSAKKNSSRLTTGSGSSASAINSSNAATKSNTSSQAVNQAVSGETSDDVVNRFASKLGFDGAKGYEIIPTAKNGSVYRFEVRRNNQDNSVANMVGIYQYNSQTGAVNKLQ